MQHPVINVAPNTATSEQIGQVFKKQQAYASVVAKTTAKERKQKLKRLLDYMMTHTDEIAQVIYEDFKKPHTESILTEILILKQEAKHAIKHLGSWMKDKRVRAPLTALGTFSHIRYEPKGTTLIISPWNYPFQLCIGPLISAIAAGNVAILKPSEMTPHTSTFIRKMITDLFEEQEIAVFEGDYQIAQSLLALPFNHIHFTGSPQVGKIVMKAAAEHLSSVTLELGGKSPTIVDETANLKDAAEKIAWGKSLNNGQTCIAPDYLLIHESVKQPFIDAYKKALKKMYPHQGGVVEDDSYARIVNAKHFRRINSLLEDAIDNGAKVEAGGKVIADENFIEPTLLSEVDEEMSIMREEIFGPVLPLVSYTDKSDALALINDKERPLALYIYSRNQKNIDYFLGGAISGDSVINDNMIHFSHTELPFGGINNSGIGKSGGYAGFKSFSHERSVLKQVYGTLKPLYPPYTEKVKKIVKFLLKMV